MISWLISTESRGHLDPTEYSRRTIDLIEAARRFAQQKVKGGQERDQNGRKVSLKIITKRNIRNLVMKEQGSSLYRLIRDMDRWRKDQEELREDTVGDAVDNRGILYC